MRLSVKIIVGAAIVAASVAAATFGASAPAAASETTQTAGTGATDFSAREKKRSTNLRVAKLSRRASEPPNANRSYYRPVPHFYPFAQQRGYF
jgi:hypothetical protein